MFSDLFAMQLNFQVRMQVREWHSDGVRTRGVGLLKSKFKECLEIVGLPVFLLAHTITDANRMWLASKKNSEAWTQTQLGWPYQPGNIWHLICAVKRKKL